MTVFEEIKEYVTARDVAEHYGLKVNPKGVACCPFHDDHHPSMKIDKTYICFACGAKGDAIQYVSDMFCLKPIDAAHKIAEDFHLPIAIGKKNQQELAKAREQYLKQKKEKVLREDRQNRFRKWQFGEINHLKDILLNIRFIEENVLELIGEDFMNSDDFAELMHAKPILEYWLDILCLYPEKDRLLLFINDRKEVDRFARHVDEINRRITRRGISDSGSGRSQCGKSA